MSDGIYRNVYLHVLAPVHVTLLNYAYLKTECIYPWTKSLQKNQVTVSAIAEIENRVTRQFLLRYPPNCPVARHLSIAPKPQ